MRKICANYQVSIEAKSKVIAQGKCVCKQQEVEGNSMICVVSFRQLKGSNSSVTKAV